MGLLPAGTTQETSERVKQRLAGAKGLQDDEDRSDWLEEVEEGRDGVEFGVQHSLPCHSMSWQVVAAMTCYDMPSPPCSIGRVWSMS